MKRLITAATLAATFLAGCALDPLAGGGAFSSNTARAYIYTPEEQAAMTAQGTIPTMTSPSEIRERLANAGKETKPTGEVNYCDAGLASLIQARRDEALTAVATACGGPDQYQVRHEGLGNVKARYAGNFKLTPGCTRSKVIIFRCNGAQPKPEMRK